MAEIKWVKKKITATEWKNYYGQIPAYCFLSKDREGVWVGFLMATALPADCKPLSVEELRRVDEYRRTANVRPFPFQDVKKDEGMCL